MVAKQDSEEIFGRPARSGVRGNVRDPVREPLREGRGNRVVQGRNGEQLSRKRKDDGTDPFHIPPEIVPPGWSYQWVANSVSGNADIVADQNLMFYENGWRPVPADRHEGRYMPVGHKGNITRGGQTLMERPKELTDEAKGEMEDKARRQMMDRDDALLGGRANFRGNTKGQGIPVRGTGDRNGNALRMQIDPALDIVPPSHPLAEAGE